ncbi:ABC transporter substrate-binding protein [Notoacmeibacter sp. MSK16QG-6]|uniref:ABC transporter substrate-binding protein n=1 Tax=Notoacmeibacter sp. MSK16QG-6 TaxID=2957982 RepID=UPI00209FAF46|nr:ABC transporter substrate-binding protein [Notoacmeibacter sp. MSK16QG-6]MCP1199537.1 ABC transporter substrate-binding protein [Notoacmeibacter sp. MSK16QG-6]
MAYKLGRIAAAFMVSAVAGHAMAQEVTVVLAEELDNVDPCEASRSNIGRVILQNVSETLTELVPGTGVEPRLATSWEETEKGTWRFHLREGVKFSDGTAFDAEDVAHSIARMTNPDLICEIGNKYFGGIELKTNVVDENTIDITPDPVQPIMPLLASTITIAPSEAPMDAYVDVPIGTGPYVWDEYVRGQRIKLSANPDYWGEAPSVTGATYLFRSDASVRAAMVKTGEADIAPNIALQDATTDMDFSYPNSETVYMRLDHSIPPLDDVRVRQALNYAVDKEAFLGTILADGTIIAKGITPPSTIGYNDEVEPYPFDLEKAKALLAEAKADGVPVDTKITVVGRIGNFSAVQETMEALLSMWQDAGFNIELQMQEVGDWVEHLVRPFAEDRGPEIVQAMHDNANGDPVFSMFFKYDCEGAQSATCDEKLDTMIEEATALSGDERAAKWSETFAYTHEIAADVMLWHMVGFSRVNPRLDFEPTIKTNSELQLGQIKFN